MTLLDFGCGIGGPRHEGFGEWARVNAMRIGELAEATGVSARSLRYYEGLGLIRSARTGGGWRDFDESSVDRVVLIQHLFAAGLGSTTVREVLPCLDAPAEERTGMLEVVLAKEADRLEGLRRDIDRELDVLQALQAEHALGPGGDRIGGSSR
jgi:DNA-binding transcriptional MerR regulator